MRELIDRNNVITSIVKSLGIRSTDYLLPAEKAIVKVIQKEPTVCDIDALLKEIEQQIRVYYEMQNGDMSGSNDYKYRAQGLQKAQDIISKHLKGGKE